MASIVPELEAPLAALAARLIDGVGGFPLRIEIIGVAVHARRQLRRLELDLLDPEWLACPAVDRAGSGRLLELRP